MPGVIDRIDDPAVLADHDAIGIGLDLDRAPDRAGGHRVLVVVEALLHARGCGSRNFDELNAWLLDRCIAYAKAHAHAPARPRSRPALLPARRPRAGNWLDQIMAAHLQEAAIVETALADENRLHRHLHVVVPRLRSP